MGCAGGEIDVDEAVRIICKLGIALLEEGPEGQHLRRVPAVGDVPGRREAGILPPDSPGKGQR